MQLTPVVIPTLFVGSKPDTEETLGKLDPSNTSMPLPDPASSESSDVLDEQLPNIAKAQGMN